jgi:hypothetical protein
LPALLQIFTAYILLLFFFFKKKKHVSHDSVLDLPLNPPEPCPSTSAYSALVAEVTAGLPVSEARHHIYTVEYRAVSGVFPLNY